MAEQNGGGAAQLTGEVEVLAVADPQNDRKWKSQKGMEYLSYRIKIKLPDGSEAGNVEINTKADDPKKVTVGERIFGEFDPRPDNPHGPRFFKKQQGGFGGGGGGRRSGPSPLEQCRMQRQHSQMVAVDFAAKAGWLDGIEPTDEQKIVDLLAKKDGPLKKLIDLFDHDIDRGATVALERRKKDGTVGD